LWLAPLINANDLAVQHRGVPIRKTARDVLSQFSERGERIPIARDHLAAVMLDDGAGARKPSYFNSKIQLGSSNGEGRDCSGMG
jgi:hypothetical protein